MAGDIEHKDLPDSLCHEPKGASTATAGTVYIADGNGAGAFGKLPVSSLNMTIESVANMVTPSIVTPVSITDGGLSQTATGILTDVSAYVGIPPAITTKINLTSSELYRFANNQTTINNQVSTAITDIVTKLNQILTALKNEGLIDE